MWTASSPGRTARRLQPTRSARSSIRGDEHKRALERALTTAFTTPLEPEDLYTLSRGIDWILNLSKDLVRESEVMATPPDEPLAEMCEALARSVHLVSDAVHLLGSDSEAATEKANEALRAQRQIEKVYRDAMAALVESDDLKGGLRPAGALPARRPHRRGRRRRRRARLVHGRQGGLSCAPDPERAGDRARTGDIQLGRLALYQLSYTRARLA